MYIERTRGYSSSDGQQHVGRGKFLILCQRESDKGNGPLRAIVRTVALHQFGHWMMGTARAKGHSIAISGAYGSDGLPKVVPDDVWEIAVPLPDELYQAWNKGGGWNSAGSEAEAMRQWAKENIKELSPKA